MNSEPGGGPRGPLVFISAAEPSADLHGANLIRAVRRRDPEVRFVGVAGPCMRQAGCDAIYDMTAHAAMAGGILKVIPQALGLLRACKRYFKQHAVDLAVLIDSPTLNLPIAKRARRAGAGVLYYIAPQVWAWAEGRVRRVRARVDRLAVILPFEEDFFRGHGIEARYVGHPLFDTLVERKIDADEVQRLRARGSPVISILPGSRAHVASEVFGGQWEVAQAISARFAGAHFCISVANERTRPIIESRLAGTSLRHSLHSGENGALLTASDLALVASGTATLETAFYHAPMIVMYNASPFWYHVVGRWFIKTRHLSLVNILAGRELVPEFMPYYRSTQPIIAKALELLESEEALKQMRADLAQIVAPLAKTGAADNTADIVMEMLCSNRGG